MRINEHCAECLWNRQKKLTDNRDYLYEIRQIIDSRRENDCSPYIIYLFNQVYERYFGKRPSYYEEKKTYNDLLLSMEDVFRKRIENSDDPLKTAFIYSRLGNYIDFGAFSNVNKDEFLSLFDNAQLPENDLSVYNSFLDQCRLGNRFLLIADNCGEIVLDKLFLERLKLSYPALEISVMVRGGEALNDVTAEDAEYVHIDRIAHIVSNGKPVSGTVYKLLSEEAKSYIDNADIIFAKGQGNYESLAGQGLHIFYSFLCKCDLFTTKFNVPRFTGIFIEENPRKNDWI